MFRASTNPGMILSPLTSPEVGRTKGAAGVRLDLRRLEHQWRKARATLGDVREVLFPRARFPTCHIHLDFPAYPRSRWGYGTPPHPALFRLLEARKPEFERVLAAMALRRDALDGVSVEANPARPEEPSWENEFIPALDLVALYSFVAGRAPRTYLEIGSGNSTKIAARAIRDHRLATTVVSVDPEPRAEVDGLCSRLVRQPLEEVDLDLIPPIESGDVVFFDGSHRVFPNSDVTVFFLDLLPRMPRGVLVGVHDVYLPWDYPPAILKRFYSEQYLLAARLLAPDPGIRPVLPNAFVSHDSDLLDILNPIWQRTGMERVPREGVAFWFETG